MIFVDRTAMKPPEELLKFQEKALIDLGKIYDDDGVSRAQRRPDFRMPPKLLPIVRAGLKDLFKGKCAYCERAGVAIDHFRPKWRAGRLDRRIDPEHYWWLVGEWSNLYLCCQECNSRKANAFPIDGPPALSRTFGVDLRSEKRLLIDPCEDDPVEHLSFLLTGEVVPLTRSGEVTVQMFELNNPYLVDARKTTASYVIQRCELLWEKNTINNRDSARFLEFALGEIGGNHLAAASAGIREFVSRKFNDGTYETTRRLSRSPAVDLQKPVWLDKVEIKNFKSIDSLELKFPGFEDLSHDDTLGLDIADRVEELGQPWLMVLGENGVGKSSLLQAISLALMSDVERNAQGRPASWLRRSSGAKIKSGSVRLTFSDGSIRSLAFQKGISRFTVEGVAPPMPVLAYGSTRLLPKRSTKKQEPAQVSVTNLFDHRHPLCHAERYLCDQSAVTEDQFQILAGALKSLLPISEDTELKRKKTQLTARVANRNVTLAELSDGYKSMLALAMDIMFHLTNSSFDMESARGLVMIDELELHLHPRWKAIIVRQLRSLFPNVRFIATTHDPLCVLGLRAKELHVITVHPLAREMLVESIDVPKGMRADEVLTGPWFGVASTIDAETQQLMDDHSKLIQRPALGSDEEGRREKLEALLNHRLGSFAITRTQRAVLAAAAVLKTGRAGHQLDSVVQQRLGKLLGDQAFPSEGDPRA